MFGRVLPFGPGLDSLSDLLGLRLPLPLQSRPAPISDGIQARTEQLELYQGKMAIVSCWPIGRHLPASPTPTPLPTGAGAGGGAGASPDPFRLSPWDLRSLHSLTLSRGSSIKSKLVRLAFDENPSRNPNPRERRRECTSHGRCSSQKVSVGTRRSSQAWSWPSGGQASLRSISSRFRASILQDARSSHARRP